MNRKTFKDFSELYFLVRENLKKFEEKNEYIQKIMIESQLLELKVVMIIQILGDIKLEQIKSYHLEIFIKNIFQETTDKLTKIKIKNLFIILYEITRIV